MTHLETTLSNLESAFETFKKDQMNRLDQLEAKHNRPALDRDNVSGMAEDHEHKDAFVSYLKKGDGHQLRGFEQKSLSSGIDKDGGYFIPKALSSRLNKKLAGLSVMREISNVMTISTDSVELLINQAGAKAGWVAETDDRAETNTPEMAKIKIPVHEMYARPRATSKLLEDANINVEDWLIHRISQTMAQMENHAFILGDGKKKPKGFLSYNTKDKKDWAWGSFEHITSGKPGAFNPDKGADTLIDCVNALKPEYHPGAVWLMSRSAHTAIRKLKDQTGSYLWQPGLGTDHPSTLLGFPVKISDDMPELEPAKACTSIAFGNFKQGYQIVDRRSMHVLRDPFSVKPFVEFYTTSRVGGDVMDFEALKMIRFNN